jgi:hypothetical protein
VTHFFDLMRLPNSPAGARWAACFMAAFGSQSLNVRLE